jgi:serine/threonine protein kinase/tetratricopeptide (TPR) repeat protein
MDRIANSSSSRDPTGYNGLTDEQADLVDATCDQFEKAWRSGQAPAIEEYLGKAPVASRGVLLQELMLVDVAYRHSAGQQLSVEQYQARFPELDRSWVTGVVVSTLSGSPFKGVSKSGSADLPSIPGYEILEEIGRGSMGVVYRAIQLRLARVVAIKTLPIFSRNHRELNARFRSEAEAVAKLDHAGIVQIFDVDYQAAVPYFSMEYIAGGSLGQYLQQRPLPPRVAAKLVAQLAEAIHYAHQQGIVHRDLKPENVLLQPSSPDQQGIRLADEFHEIDSSKVGQGSNLTVPATRELPEHSSSDFQNCSYWLPKITDFGLAKQFDTASNLTVDGTLLGTPSYMAPEQTGLADRPLSCACDIYGLGAILYAALVGRPPFLAATVIDTIQLVRVADPTPPTRLQPGVPRDLETICLKCLAKKPEQRFATALELAEDIKRFLSHQPIRSRAISSFGRLLLWRQRNPTIANMLLLLGLTLVTAVLVTSWQWFRAEQNARQLSEERDKVSQERTRAQHHLDRSREAIDELATVGQILLGTPGKEKAGRDALERLVSYCEGFLDDDSDDPRVIYQTAIASLRLGRLNVFLGHQQAADLAYQRSRDLLQLLQQKDPGERSYSAGFARSLSEHANLLRDMNRSSEAGEVYRRAIVEWEQIIANGDSSGDRKVTLANVFANYVLVRDPQKDGVELKQMIAHGVQLIESSLETEPSNRSWKVEYIIQLEALANLHLTLGEVSEAEAILDRVMGIWLDLNPSQEDPSARYRMALTHMLRAKVYREINRLEQEDDCYREAHEILTAIVETSPNVRVYQLTLLDAIQSLASSHLREASEIKQLRKQTCDVAAKVEKEGDPTNVAARLRHANALLNYVVFLDVQQDALEIEQCFSLAITKIRDALALEANNWSAHLEHALALDDYGVHWMRKQDLRQAETLVEQALHLRDWIATQTAEFSDIDYYRARSRANLAAIYRHTQRLDKAREVTEQAIGLLLPVVDKHPHHIAYRKLLMEQHLSLVGLLRNAGDSHAAWRSKLASYLEYNAIVRIPHSPVLTGEYPLFLNQLVAEGKQYEGANAELAEKILDDLELFTKWLDSNPSPFNEKGICAVFRRSINALV